MTMQEDDVLELAACFLEGLKFRVLALGANQAGLFSFKTNRGRRKYPDLVASRGNILGVFEGKIRSSDLFVSSHVNKQSDYEAMVWLLSSIRAQEYLIARAKSVLRGLGFQQPDQMSICVGLIASDSFKRVLQKAEDTRVILMVVDVETSRVSIVRDDLNLMRNVVS